MSGADFGSIVRITFSDSLQATHQTNGDKGILPVDHKGKLYMIVGFNNIRRAVLDENGGGQSEYYTTWKLIELPDSRKICRDIEGWKSVGGEVLQIHAFVAGGGYQLEVAGNAKVTFDISMTPARAAEV